MLIRWVKKSMSTVEVTYSLTDENSMKEFDRPCLFRVLLLAPTIFTHPAWNPLHRRRGVRDRQRPGERKKGGEGNDDLMESNNVTTLFCYRPETIRLKNGRLAGHGTG